MEFQRERNLKLALFSNIITSYWRSISRGPFYVKGHARAKYSANTTSI